MKPRPLERDTEHIEDLLYCCIRELQYVQDAEDFCQTKSSLAQKLIENGMLALGVKWLGEDSLGAERQREITGLAGIRKPSPGSL